MGNTSFDVVPLVRSGPRKLDSTMSDSLAPKRPRCGPNMEQEHGKKEEAEPLADIQGASGSRSTTGPRTPQMTSIRLATGQTARFVGQTWNIPGQMFSSVDRENDRRIIAMSPLL